MANFNPRSREGSDQQVPQQMQMIKDFNPRSREGSDASHFRFIDATLYFNPRSREGSDMSRSGYYGKNAISIHAPAKGATIV